MPTGDGLKHRSGRGRRHAQVPSARRCLLDGVFGGSAFGRIGFGVGLAVVRLVFLGVLFTRRCASRGGGGCRRRRGGRYGRSRRRCGRGRCGRGGRLGGHRRGGGVGQGQHGSGRSDQGGGDFLHDDVLPLKMLHGAWSTSENGLRRRFVDSEKIYFLASTPLLRLALSAFSQGRADRVSRLFCRQSVKNHPAPAAPMSQRATAVCVWP